MTDVTADELAEFYRLDSERLDLDRKSRSIDGRLKPLKSKFLEFFKDAPDKLHVRRGDFELQISDGPPYVNWSERFVAIAGPDAADRIKSETEPSKRIKVIALPAAVAA